MRARDSLSFSLRALNGARTRTWLMLVALAIGVSSVILLTAIGDGARRYVNEEFMNLGSNLLTVMPGKLETTGGQPPILAGSSVKLTIEDALALTRSQSIRRVAPITIGAAPVSYQQLEREVDVIGSTASLYNIRNLEMNTGRFLPDGDASRGQAIVVLGAELKTELFGNKKAIGERVRIDSQKFQVIGTLKKEGPKGMGMSLSDAAIIPVAMAQTLFNTDSVFRVMVQADGPTAMVRAEKATIDILRTRHNGVEDVTVISADAMLKTFDTILGTLTVAVAGIASISLAVAGILIMNVMLVSISQRTNEIGLLKAIGSPNSQILIIFLLEAIMLATLGAIAGLILGYTIVLTFATVVPSFPISVPYWAPIAATSTSLGTASIFCLLPARRAARLDPVEALTG